MEVDEEDEVKRIAEESAAGITYMFNRRVPKVYNDDAFRVLDRGELEHWLTQRNIPCESRRQTPQAHTEEKTQDG